MAVCVGADPQKSIFAIDAWLAVRVALATAILPVVGMMNLYSCTYTHAPIRMHLTYMHLTYMHAPIRMHLYACTYTHAPVHMALYTCTCRGYVERCTR